MPTRIRTRFVVATSVFLASFSIFAAIVDQSQPIYNSMDDLWDGDKSGQTFVAGQDGFLTAIRLVVSGAKWNGQYPFGSDSLVRLRRVAEDGVPEYDPVAVGRFYRSEVLLNTPQWLTVALSPPYKQRPGEMLCFMLEGLSGGGPNGWDNYGNSTNLYTNGFFFTAVDFQKRTVSSEPKYDFAFETIVEPVPLLSNVRYASGSLSLEASRSYTNYLYHLEFCTNLVEGMWREHSSKTGTGTNLEWNIPTDQNTSIFYRLRTQ